MGFWNTFFNFFAKPKTAEQYTTPKTGQDQFTVGQGSVAMPTAQQTINQTERNLYAYEFEKNFDPQIYEYIQYQSTYNRHLAKALANINLANTNQIITFSPEIPPKKKAEMLAVLEKNRTKWFDGGFEALEKTFTRELVVDGAISCEPAMYPNMKGINIINFLQQKNLIIRKDVTGRAEYFQSSTANKLGKGFIYVPYQRTGKIVRGQSAFIGAVKDLLMQDDLDISVKNVAKNLGAFGLLMASLKPVQPTPTCNPEQHPEAYRAKCEAHINDIYAQISKQLTSSVVIGFKDSIDFSMGGKVDAKNAQEMIDIVKKQLITGLLQDLNFMNEPNAATDAYSKVLLKIFAEDLDGIQKTKASVWEKLYWIELVSLGYNPISITVEYESPDLKDKKAEQESFALELANQKFLVDSGIISIEDMATNVGYPMYKEMKQTTQQKNKVQSAGFSVSFAQYETSIQYPFDETLSCGVSEFSSGVDKKYEKFISSYQKDIEALYNKALKKSMKAIRAKVASEEGTISIQDTLLIFIATLIQTFEKEFVIKSTVDTHVLKAYTHYRKDSKGLSGDAKMSVDQFAEEEIPKAVFELLDWKLIDWLQKGDNFYLGKFITDPKVIDKFRQTIIQFVEENGEISAKSKELETLFESFEAQVNGQKWKIEQIVSTTINNARGFSRISYMNQLGIETYVWLEVMDRLTCAHCRVLHQKEFSVATAIEKLTKLADSSPENIRNYLNFATNVPIAEFEKMSSEDMLANNIGVGCTHNKCRRTLARK